MLKIQKPCPPQTRPNLLVAQGPMPSSNETKPARRSRTSSSLKNPLVAQRLATAVKTSSSLKDKDSSRKKRRTTTPEESPNSALKPRSGKRFRPQPIDPTDDDIDNKLMLRSRRPPADDIDNRLVLRRRPPADDMDKRLVLHRRPPADDMDNRLVQKISKTMTKPIPEK